MREQVTWLYKPANITPSDYQEELCKLREVIIPDLNNLPPTQFNPVTPDQVRQYCPRLISKLKEWGIESRIAESAFIVLAPGAHYAIHRDFPTWKARNIAMNIPVLNCENSYTVFYDAKVLDDNLYGELGKNTYVKHAHRVDEANAVEVGRCESTTPYWINVYQPHAPTVNHNNARIAFSIRFRPELFDIIQSGQFDSMLVKNV